MSNDQYIYKTDNYVIVQGMPGIFIVSGDFKMLVPEERADQFLNHVQLIVENVKDKSQADAMIDSLCKLHF